MVSIRPLILMSSSSCINPLVTVPSSPITIGITVTFMFHSFIYYYYYYNRLIGLVSRVFANGPGDLGSIPGCIIPKTLKMVLDISFLSTQQYNIRIMGKVEQSWERSSALPYTSV